MRVVTRCPHHKALLIEQGLRCQKRQLVCAPSKTQPGACTSCGHWLGTEPPVFSNQGVSEELMNWQAWIGARLKELQAARRDAGMLPWEPFFRHLAMDLQEQKGDARRAQATGIDRQNLARWVDREDPSRAALEPIRKFCYVCRVTPLQVLTGQRDQLQQTLEQGPPLRSPLVHRQNEHRDRERCRMALQAALDSKEDPPARSQVAQQSG